MGISMRRLRSEALTYHRLRNDVPGLLRRLDEVIVGEVGVAGGGPMPFVSKQLADQGQVLAPHDGVAGNGVAEIVNSKRTEIEIESIMATKQKFRPGTIWEHRKTRQCKIHSIQLIM